MTTRLTMFDGPLTGRISPFGGTPRFSQIIPDGPAPLPTLDNPDPVGHLLDVPKPQSIKDALGALTKMLLGADDSLQRDDLLREWTALAGRIEAHLTHAKEKHNAGLRQQVAELTPQCRASFDRLRALRTERGGLDSRMHVQQEQLGQARVKLTVAINNKPEDDTFPTDEEIADWRGRVARAQTAVDRETERWAQLQERIDKNEAERRAASGRLTELKQRREDCKAELEGRPRRGPFGLQIPGA